MSIPQAGNDLIDTKLDLALKTDSDERAEKHFSAVYAMLDYAMAVGHLTPQEFSDRRRLVEINRGRRHYK